MRPEAARSQPPASNGAAKWPESVTSPPSGRRRRRARRCRPMVLRAGRSPCRHPVPATTSPRRRHRRICRAASRARTALAISPPRRHLLRRSPVYATCPLSRPVAGSCHLGGHAPATAIVQLAARIRPRRTPPPQCAGRLTAPAAAPAGPAPSEPRSQRAGAPLGPPLRYAAPPATAAIRFGHAGFVPRPSPAPVSTTKPGPRGRLHRDAAPSIASSPSSSRPPGATEEEPTASVPSAAQPPPTPPTRAPSPRNPAEVKRDTPGM